MLSKWLKNGSKKTKIYEAWILDAQIHKKGVLLWLKLLSEQVISAIHEFHPSFYAVLSDIHVRSSNLSLLTCSIIEKYSEEILQIKKISYVHQVSLSLRRIRAEDSHLSYCLKISVSSPYYFKKLIQMIQNRKKYALLNIDLPLVQDYFYSMELFPFAKVKVKLSKSSKMFFIDSLSLDDSNKAIHYDLPPLRIIWIDIALKSTSFSESKYNPIQAITLTIDPDSSPIDFYQKFPSDIIRCDEQGTLELVLSDDNECQLLKYLHKAIIIVDPDVIFSHKGDENLFPLLYARSIAHKIDNHFSLSRDLAPLKMTRFIMNGSDSYFSYGRIIHRSKNQFYLNG